MTNTRDFWLPEEVPIVPVLAQLRQAVFDSQDIKKRMPRWRFRLADDLAMQIQPKDSIQRLFECRVLEGNGITRDSFGTREQRAEAWLTGSMAFDLLTEFTRLEITKDVETADLKCASDGNAYARRLYRPAEGCWLFKPSRVTERVREEGVLRFLDTQAMRERTLQALKEFPVLNALELLSDNCLCCGKGLTDAVSRSRMIGSECWQRGFRIGEQIAGGLRWEAA